MVAIMLGADNGFFYAGQVMHFSSPFTVFLIYHKHTDHMFSEIIQQNLSSVNILTLIYIKFIYRITINKKTPQYRQTANAYII